jgi:hypothetical protein
MELRMDTINNNEQNNGLEEFKNNISKLKESFQNKIDSYEKRLTSNKIQRDIDNISFDDLMYRVNNIEHTIYLNTYKVEKKTKRKIHKLKDRISNLEYDLDYTPTLDEFKKQNRKIKKLEIQLNKTQEVVYQLLGGLFCHRTQSAILEEHTAKLFDIPYNPDLNQEDTHKYGHYPVTRQGDENEKRIARLESLVANMMNTKGPINLKYDYDYEENASISTHSSMPELVAHSDEESDTESDEDPLEKYNKYRL